MRVHQHKAGVKDQAISNNVGGNSSIIYLVVDADGNPIESISIHNMNLDPFLSL